MKVTRGILGRPGPRDQRIPTLNLSHLLKEFMSLVEVIPVRL